MTPTFAPAFSMLLAIGATAVQAPLSSPTTCPFSAWTNFRGTPLLRTSDASAYFYIPTHKSVDADGAPNAYHPADVNGRACPDTGQGLECPANAGYFSRNGRGNSDWWSSVLIPDPDNRRMAFEQRQGVHRGFFVSQTSLQNTRAFGPRDPRSYVDATQVPYLVMPGPFHAMAGTGSMGDVGVALNLDTGASTPFVFADVGPPDAHLGEGSIALWRALGGNNPNPRNGEGVPRGRIAIVAFPNSRTTVSLGWPIDLEILRRAATERLARLGGMETMRRCAL